MKGKASGLSGQTTMIAIVLIILVFGVVVLFLSSFVGFQSQEDYLNLYTGNALISILRTDTGYTNHPESCGRIIDVLFCSEYTPSFRCGGTECKSLAGVLVDTHMDKILKPQLDYLLKYGQEKTIGNQALELEETRWLAHEDLRRGTQRLYVTLIMAAG
jgi:hypothetical protein